MKEELDREHRAARFVMPIYQWSEPDSSTPERALETSVLLWRGAIGIDLLENTTTVVRSTTATEFPTMAAKEIERKFSISDLTSGR